MNNSSQDLGCDAMWYYGRVPVLQWCHNPENLDLNLTSVMKIWNGNFLRFLYCSNLCHLKYWKF